MARAFIEGVLLFLTPFGLFGLWLFSTRNLHGARDAFSGAFGWLTMAGLALAIASILWGGFKTEHPTGTYVPAHQENGVLVPSRIK